MKSLAKFARLWAPLALTFVFVCLPLIGLAQTTVTYPSPTTVTYPQPTTVTAPGQSGSGNNTCTGASCSLQNPLKVSNFCDLLKVVLDAVLLIGVPVAVLFLVLVGFKFVLAQGNAAAITAAQKNFFHTVVGIAIFLGAWTIAKIIASTLALLGVPGLGSCIR